MSGDAEFLTTRWSLVLAAGGEDGGAREALGELCRRYWFPLYAFLRRRGHAHAAAEDLVQGFFAALLERRSLESVAPEKGRFRSFLLASLRHFESNEREREGALKRGGGRVSLSIDFSRADARFERELASDATPERAFDRAWALALLESTLAGLAEEYERDGRGRVFEALKTTLELGRPHAELAAELSMTEGAVRVAVHRLRRRWRERLLQEVEQTVTEPESAELELRALFEALGPSSSAGSHENSPAPL